MKVYRPNNMVEHWFTFDDAQTCIRKGCVIRTFKVVTYRHGNVVFAMRMCSLCHASYNLLILVDKKHWTARFFPKT